MQFDISTDPARLDIDVIHGFLRDAYWSPGVPRRVVERSIAHSMPFGAYAPNGGQAGFGRVVTDRAAFAYIGDLFVLEPYRGHGLGVELVRAMLEHPELQGLRRWSLWTGDAHSLYERFGFTALPRPGEVMVLERPPAELWA